MPDAYTASALTAALAVADRYGLPARAPQVLRDNSNVLVRLGSVVARVPGTTRLLRPDAAAWLGRDVALARHLTESGVPVVSPTTDPPAGPHIGYGLPVTLWHWTPHDPDHRHTPDEVARSLAAVHAALRTFPGELPTLGPVSEIQSVLERHRATLDGAAPRIHDEALRLAARLGSAAGQALHGDAHPGNVLATAAGPCWLDFEDTWHGPLAWDLATLANQGGPEFLAAYPGAVDPAEVAVCGRLRELFVVVWRFLTAIRFPHRRGEAQAALAAYFAG